MGKYNINCSPDINNPKMSWAFGFTAADGSLVKTNRTRDPNIISYTLNAKDADVLYKIKHIFQLDHPVKFYTNNQGKDTVYLRFTDNRYEHLLFSKDQLNIKNAFPQSFINNNTRHYLRGLIDGDGCLHHRKRGGFMIVFINENEEIVKNFSYCVAKYLGLSFKIPKLVEKDHIWRIQYESRSARILAWWLYHGEIDEMSLQRKRDSYQSMVNPLNNNLDQFFDAFFGKELRYIPKRKNNGLIVPIPMNNHANSLNICKGIQNVCSAYNVKSIPLPVNKGNVKYYIPYFPKEYVSSIKMLRPFKYLLEG